MARAKPASSPRTTRPPKSHPRGRSRTRPQNSEQPSESVSDFPLLVRRSNYVDEENRVTYERVFGRPVPDRRLPKGPRGESPTGLPLWRGDVRPLYFPPMPITVEAACQWFAFQLREMDILARYGWRDSDANEAVHDACLLAYHLRTEAGMQISVPWKSGERYALEEGMMLLRDALDKLSGAGSAVAYLGDHRIKVGDRVLTLEPSEGDAVQTLVKQRSGLLTALAKDSGVDDFHRVIRRVVRKFPQLKDWIFIPERRGAGGYSTMIADESE